MKIYKKLIYFCVFILALTLSNQAFAQSEYVFNRQLSEDATYKFEIDPAKLPPKVKVAIKKSNLALWKMKEVYQITKLEDKKKTTYEVHFTNRFGQEQLEVFDSNGKKEKIDG